MSLLTAGIVTKSEITVRRCPIEFLEVEFAEPQAIHDRSITTDTGWKILLGRGLDVFQRMSDSPFDLATKYQKYREVKGFGITYIRESVAERHDAGDGSAPGS